MPACNCEPNVCIDGSLLGSFFQKLLRSLKRFHKNPNSIFLESFILKIFCHIMPHFQDLAPVLPVLYTRKPSWRRLWGKYHNINLFVLPKKHETPKTTWNSKNLAILKLEKTFNGLFDDLPKKKKQPQRIINIRNQTWLISHSRLWSPILFV